MTKQMTKEQHSFTLLFEPAEEGGYVVTCPALPGLVTEGDTFDEALANAVEALAALVESYAAHGERVPWIKDVPRKEEGEEERHLLLHQL